MHNLNPIASAIHAQAPARVARLKCALDSIGPGDFEAVAPGKSIQSLAPDWSGPFVCSIDGQYISRDDWHSAVRAGEVVVFQQLPQGGGGGGGSDPVRSVLTIALMVAAVAYGPWVGGLIGGATGIGMSAATAAAVGQAAILVGGTLLLNALVPLPKPRLGDTQSPTYTVSLQGNNARPGSPIPVGYGHHLTYPDFAVQPYSRWENNESYYHAILCIGRGKYHVCKVAIDDTELSTFQDVEYVIVGPGQDVEDVTGQELVNPSLVTALEVNGQELNKAEVGKEWVGPFSPTRAGFPVDAIEIDVSLPKGLAWVDNEGDYHTRTVQWQVQARQIDDDEQPIGGWLTLATETHTEATGQPSFLTKSYDLRQPGLGPSRYQVRIKRVTTFDENQKVLNDLMWTGMRARITDYPENTEVARAASLTNPAGLRDRTSTYLCLRIRASKQLSGMSQRKVNVLWKRILPTWNGIAWIEQPTRNPAWAIADIWRNQDYGRGLPDSRIDLDTLLALANVWDQRQDRFDYVFDSQTTVFEAAQLAARAGRAVPLVRRGKYTLVRDSAQSIPVCSFSPRNMRAGTMRLEYGLPTEETPDAIKLKFRDGKYWDERILLAQVDPKTEAVAVYTDNARPSNLPAPKTVLEVDMPGVVGRKHAMREAAYLAATGYYRRVSGSFQADVEAMIPTYGSLVAVSHDVPKWGQHGEVAFWDPVSRTMVLRSAVQWGTGTHYVRVQGRYGELSNEVAVTPGGTGDTLILASDPGVDVISVGDPDLEPSKILFGPAGAVTQMVRIKGIKPTGQNDISVSFVVDDARVHTVDAAWLPGVGETQDAIFCADAANVTPTGVLYLAIAGGGSQIWSSPDLETWTLSSGYTESGKAITWSGLYADSASDRVYLHGSIMPSGGGASQPIIVHTADGTSFTRAYITGATAGSVVTAIARNDLGMLAVAFNGLPLLSADGLTWTAASTMTNSAQRDVVGAQTRWVGTGSGQANARVSTDNASSWQIKAAPSAIAYIARNSDTGVLAAVAPGTTSKICMSSDGGDTWTEVNAGATVPGFRDITYGGGKFVAVGAGGWVSRSSGGALWSSVQIAGGAELSQVTWDGEKFLVGGSNGYFAKSTDGANWVALSIPGAASGSVKVAALL